MIPKQFKYYIAVLIVVNQRLTSLLFILVFILFIPACTASKAPRYEQKPKEEEKIIEPTTLLKTMDVRERELIKKLKISAVDRIRFEYDSKGKLVNKGKLSTAKYDLKGFLTETTIFDKNGRAQNRFEYKYSDKGFRIEAWRYDAQNKPDKKYTYEYDKAGNKIKSTRYNLKGKAEKYYEYDYDSNLNLISDEWYDADGNSEYKIENEYNDEGMKTTSSSYDENDRLNFRYIYKYDDNKNIIEEQKYDDNEKLIGIIQYLYKYY